VSRLFIELYLDEDVDVLVAKLIRSRGFVVSTTLEAGQLGKDDDEQLAFAVSHQMAFVTHNRRHFEALVEQYFAAGRMHWGVIVAVRRTPYEIARRLLKILNHVTADDMQNQLRYI
jgi:hypothetical protein